MRCSVQEVRRLTGEEFEQAFICARAETIVKEQLDKEATRQR